MIKKYLKILPLLILTISILMCIGYASVNSIITKIDGQAIAKMQDEIFITNIEYLNQSSNEYVIKSMVNKDSLNSSISLDQNNKDSKISIKLSFYNSTNDNYKFIGATYDQQLSETMPDIYSNKNIKYEVSPLNSNILKNGGSLDLTITFSYDNYSTENVSNILNSIIKFNFKKYYTITYENIINNNYPTEILENNNLDVTFINNLPDGLLITGTNTYSYQNYNLKINNITNDLIIKDAVLYRHDGDYIFTGTNYIDTNVFLWNEELFPKNFEIKFNITSLGTNTESYTTLMNTMNESDGSFFPGVTFRINYYLKVFEVVSDDELNGELDHTYIEYNLNTTNKVEIYRINNIIYISVNDGALTKVRDYTGWNDYFEVPATFGAALDGNKQPMRYYNGTLSNLKIKVLNNDGLQEFDMNT